MYVNPKMNYRGNLSINKQRWTKIYRSKTLLMKGCNKFYNRPRESNPLTMTMFLERAMISKSNIVCLR
jgi:hypothetical protein